ncbi:peptidase S59, nucleoporin [Artemisia annua]|uniref:Peptidase S59, nucleoporin n=1 Tax=Artemisia annua TaxID=35608 RepID=A0A2U1KB45_ARTAN|nr:peptidase S59, nucleoporin [Artemisia annua]
MVIPCNCSACHQSQSQTAFGSSVSGSSSFVFPSALPLESSNQCTCGATTSAFGGQSFSFGGQSTAPAFQSSGFGASSMSAFGPTTMSGSFESPFQQSQPGFSLSITFPSSSCGPTHFEVSSQPASNNTSAVFGQCVGLTVTPFYYTTPKSTAFTFSPACIQISVNPCSSSTSTNQSDPKKSSFFTPFQSAPSRFCPIHGFRQSPLRCQCAVSRVATYDQTPQAHNCTNTTPKSTDNTFGPECTQKSVNPCSSSTSTNVFSLMKSTSSNPAQSTPFGFCPNHGSPFGCQCSASKVTLNAQTPKADNGRGAQPAEKLFSISAMPAYKEKSHEELRCEDYQLGDKGGPTRSNMQSSSFTFTPAISHTHANPFSSFTSTEPCIPKTSISQTLSVSVGSRVTPYAQTPHADNGSDTTSKSTGFTFPGIFDIPYSHTSSRLWDQVLFVIRLVKPNFGLDQLEARRYLQLDDEPVPMKKSSLATNELEFSSDIGISEP